MLPLYTCCHVGSFNRNLQIKQLDKAHLPMTHKHALYHYRHAQHTMIPRERDRLAYDPTVHTYKCAKKKQDHFLLLKFGTLPVVILIKCFMCFQDVLAALAHFLEFKLVKISSNVP